MKSMGMALASIVFSAFLAGLIMGGALDAKTHAFNQEEFTDFMDRAAHFERTLLGCPDDARFTVECSPERGVFNKPLWDQVQKRGEKLFGK